MEEAPKGQMGLEKEYFYQLEPRNFKYTKLEQPIKPASSQAWTNLYLFTLIFCRICIQTIKFRGSDLKFNLKKLGGQ
jgi:hypothetical protein